MRRSKRSQNDALFARMGNFNYQIEGFPTIMLFNNRENKKILYTRNRTVKSISAFLDAVMERGNWTTPRDSVYYES